MALCAKCNDSAIYFYFDSESGSWVCKKCWVRPQKADTCRLFEKGRENPIDPQGTTAHVRDIKKRRLDPQTNKTVYYEPKTYFFPKG